MADPSIQQQIDDHLAAMRSALNLSSHQALEITEEIEADLQDRIAQLQAEGLSPADAAAAALQDLGNPYEVAHHVRREVPLFGHPAVDAVRYLLAGGLFFWTLHFLWTLRAWTYGFDARIYALGLMLLPVLLLLWPKLVWRKNWLFGLVPACLGLAVLMAMMVLGTSASSESGESVGQSPAGQSVISTAIYYLLPVVMVAVACGFIYLIQQPGQRRFVLITAALVFGVVEFSYQAEEMFYRGQVQQVENYLAGVKAELGKFPERSAVSSDRVQGMQYSQSEEGKSFSLFWNRPLSDGFALAYSPDSGVRVQD